MSIFNRHIPLFSPMLNGFFRNPPSQVATHSMVFEAVQDEYMFNMHSFVTVFEGELWLIHSTNTGLVEDAPGQHVRAHRSVDGENWTEVGFVTPDPGDDVYIPRGLWNRDGQLVALVTLQGDSTPLHLRAFSLDENQETWTDLGEQITGALSNEEPRRDLEGNWAFPVRRGSRVLIARGDLGDWSEEEVSDGGPSLIEPNYLIGRNGVEQVVYRSGGEVLWAAYKEKGGEWSSLIETNFPDARSKVYRVEFEHRRYAMFSNANISPRTRETLHVSYGSDGLSFDDIRVLQDNPPPIKFGGSSARLGYQYPSAVMFGDKIAVTYSLNKEDVLCSLIDPSNI